MNYFKRGNSLFVQWLELCPFTTEGLGLIRSQGIKIPQAMQLDQKRDYLEIL